MWAAAVLKHCNRCIRDLFPLFIKNLDPVPLRHLFNPVSTLEPSAHAEQTLYLASIYRGIHTGKYDETANSGKDESNAPGSSSGHSDGSSIEVNSSHASQSAGSPSSEVQSEDTANIKALKEDEDDNHGHNPPKSSCGIDLQNSKLENQASICLGDSQSPSEKKMGQGTE
ncbi:hypothetical protein GH733_013981 [Mirounga leonina]|nr:hypothetical protein GH733_013981 [Mirounga leonina]